MQTHNLKKKNLHVNGVKKAIQCQNLQFDNVKNTVCSGQKLKSHIVSKIVSGKNESLQTQPFQIFKQNDICTSCQNCDIFILLDEYCPVWVSL